MPFRKKKSASLISFLNIQTNFQMITYLNIKKKLKYQKKISVNAGDLSEYDTTFRS